MPSPNKLTQKELDTALKVVVGLAAAALLVIGGVVGGKKLETTLKIDEGRSGAIDPCSDYTGSIRVDDVIVLDVLGNIAQERHILDTYADQKGERPDYATVRGEVACTQASPARDTYEIVLLKAGEQALEFVPDDLLGADGLPVGLSRLP